MKLATKSNDEGNDHDEDSSDRETILLTKVYYTIEGSGWGEYSMPILHLCGRNNKMQRRHVRIFGFRPRFWISESEFVERRSDIEQRMSSKNGCIIDYGHGHKLMDGLDVIDGVMLVCVVPDDVSGSNGNGNDNGLRDEFERTWEADVSFTDVFAIDKGIKRYFSVPHGVTEVHHSEVKSADSGSSKSGVSIDERVCTFDIEVQSSNGFPDAQNPSQSVTAITAHDSYTDEYWSGVLKAKGWGESTEKALRGVDSGRLSLYSTDKELCYDFLQYLGETHPDIITHWNGNRFDMPYFINRCLRLELSDVYDLSPTGDVRWIHEDGNVNHCVKGLLSWDMLDAYKSVRIGQAKSYKLENIAQDELGYGKEDVDGGEIDDVWENDPVTFLEYNIKDVSLVIDLMNETSALEDFRGRQELTGCSLDSAKYPKNLIGPSFLRHARGYLGV